MTEPTPRPDPAFKVRLGHLTSAEAAARLAAGATVLLPLGSQEDQGPHAPMGDHLLAQRLAELIARAACAAGHDTLVAPVLPFGGRDVFGSRAGGLALEQTTLRLVLRDVLRGLLRHGVTRMLVVDGHGGNAQAVHDVTQDILLERGVLIPSFRPWRIAAGLLPGLVGPQQAARSTGHGADPLASIAMHLVPELMRPDLVPCPARPRRVAAGLEVAGLGVGGFVGRYGDAEIGLPIEIAAEGDDVAVTADASLCSAATGARLTARLVALGAGLVAHLAQPDPAPN